MWTVEGQETDWPKLESLQPKRVLDFYDGPRLFTVRTPEEFELLVYQCGEDLDADRFLLVPASKKLVAEIEGNLISLRDALTQQPWAWLIDRSRDGTLSRPFAVDPLKLPEDALPEEGVRLFDDTDVLLRLRMVGVGIEAGHIPASVVKRAVDGATDAIKTLVRHVLGASAGAGRPSEIYRRYYDLPAVHFAFRSFEIAFGKPSGPRELTDADMLDRIRPLLVKGLSWAELGSESPDLPMFLAEGNWNENRLIPSFDPRLEWTAIINALAKLAPPHKGTVEEVQVSGVLIGPMYRTVRLTRRTTQRISEARRLLTPDIQSHTDTGYVREFDKDRLTFTLRDAKGETLRSVEFSEEQYGDALVAFETDRPVTVVTTQSAGTTSTELVSITFGASADGETSGNAEPA
jgi:hypothetical protein